MVRLHRHHQRPQHRRSFTLLGPVFLYTVLAITTGCSRAESSDLLYSLDVTDLTDATVLQISGDPVVTIVGQEIEITARSENWHTLDVALSPLELAPGGTYRFTATGTAPAGTEIGWHRSEAPWTYIDGRSTTDSSGEWEIAAVITYPVLPEMGSMRIQTNGAPNADLTIRSIRVYQIPTADATEVATPAWDLTVPSLHEVFEPYFLIGNIYSTSSIMNQFDTRNAFLHHFNAVTAENWHKPDSIAGPNSRFTRPTAEQFDFTQADAVVDWAVENDLALTGHALVWHSQSPQWLFRSAVDVPLTRAEALENMEFYIRTLSEYWEQRGLRDRFYSWDVVNEAIASGGGTWRGDWRTQMRTDSGWWNAFANGYVADQGEHPSDFVFYAFYFARRYFPKSVLYYNDYNEEIPAKRNAIAQMVEHINQRWTQHREYDGRLLIEGIGMQGHYHLRGWRTNFNNVRAAIERYVATGAGVSVTELDITIGGYGSPPPDPADLPDLLEEQAAAFRQLFGYYREFADSIHRVSFWGMADSQSWRSPGQPLLFDALFNAKPAFEAILEVGLGD